MKVLSEHGAREIRVPQLGEGLREARIVDLLRAPGAPLRRGDSLYVIETDKTTVELEAPFDQHRPPFREILAGDFGLEEFRVRIDLRGKQERHIQHGSALGEALADTLLLGKRVGHGGSGNGGPGEIPSSGRQ